VTFKYTSQKNDASFKLETPHEGGVSCNKDKTGV